MQKAINLYDWVREDAPVDYQHFFECVSKVFLQGIRSKIAPEEARKKADDFAVAFLCLVEAHNESFGINGLKGKPKGKDLQWLRDIRIRKDKEDACPQEK